MLKRSYLPRPLRVVVRTTNSLQPASMENVYFRFFFSQNISKLYFSVLFIQYFCEINFPLSLLPVLFNYRFTIKFKMQISFTRTSLLTSHRIPFFLVANLRITQSRGYRDHLVRDSCKDNKIIRFPPFLSQTRPSIIHLTFLCPCRLGPCWVCCFQNH